jgi:hypothetical protein
MKKSVRFILLAGVLCLTSWLSANTTAQAATPWCVDLYGESCRVSGAQAHCLWPGNVWGLCVCSDHFWDCH